MNPWTRRRLLKASLAAAGGSLLPWRQAAAQTSLLSAPRRALVIGNSRYAFAPLKNPANDANAIAGELKGTGFVVTAATDLNRERMLDAIRAYGETLARDKAVVIFPDWRMASAAICSSLREIIIKRAFRRATFLYNLAKTRAMKSLFFE